MQEDEQTAQDIFNRNEHNNPFKVKLPSHHASIQNLNMLTSCYILNKIALLPFFQNQKLTQLYKHSLDSLLNSEPKWFANQDFVEGLASHLQNWQIMMNIFGTWPYTRACFYFLEEKVRNRTNQLEKIMLRRSLLESNKQDFINKSTNVDFKSQQLRLVGRLCRKEDFISEQEEYQLPRDILFIDSDQCWKELERQLNNHSLDVEEVKDYLTEYQQAGLTRFVKKNFREDNFQQLLLRIELRAKVIQGVMNEVGQEMREMIKMLKFKGDEKMNKNS